MDNKLGSSGQQLVITARESKNVEICFVDLFHGYNGKRSKIIQLVGKHQSDSFPISILTEDEKPLGEGR